MKYFVLVLALFFFYSGFCQDSKRPCPRFIIDKESGKILTDNFSLYYDQFNQYADLSPVFIKKTAFLSILRSLVLGSDGLVDYSINGFRIYLAQDPLSRTPKKIKLIFAPLRDDVETEKYWTVNDDGSSHLNKSSEIVALKRWVKYYDTTTLKYTNTVVPNNTSTYIFNKGIIYDILSELSKQKSNDSIKGLNFLLGAYPDDFGKYSKRIMMGFTFIKNDDSETYIEENSSPYGCNILLEESFKDQNFKLMEKNASSNNQKILIDFLLLSAINGDTGVPCPPGTGCGVAKLQQ